MSAPKSTTTSIRSAIAQRERRNAGNRARQEAALGRNLRHREGLTGSIRQEHLIDPRVAAVQKPQAVFPALDDVVGLHDAIHDERIAEKTVPVERIEDERRFRQTQVLLHRNRPAQLSTEKVSRWSFRALH